MSQEHHKVEIDFNLNITFRFPDRFIFRYDSDDVEIKRLVSQLKKSDEALASGVKAATPPLPPS